MHSNKCIYTLSSSVFYQKMWKLVWSYANYNYKVNILNNALYVFDVCDYGWWFDLCEYLWLCVCMKNQCNILWEGWEGQENSQTTQFLYQFNYKLSMWLRTNHLKNSSPSSFSYKIGCFVRLTSSWWLLDVSQVIYIYIK